MSDLEAQRVAETTEFHAALGLCITRWAEVEKSLQDLFELCLQKANFQLLAAAFYSIDNFRAKIGMIDAIFSVALRNSRSLKKWNGKGELHSRLVAKARIRNTIAHSMMIWVSLNKPGNRAYLRRTLFDPTMPKFIPTRPSHGYFTRDLIGFAGDFYVLSVDLRAFGTQIQRPLKRFLRLSAQEQRRLYSRAVRSLNRAVREVLREP